MVHRGSDPVNPGWTRAYAYNEASQLEPAKQSNRLTLSSIGLTTETYSTGGNGYDAHGSMLRMPQLQIMQWNFKDQLLMTQRQAVNATDDEGVQRQGERTWYVYDAGGQRVRKVTEMAAGQVREERIHFGGFEIYRRQGANSLVRETLHIMDDQQRIAMVETRTLDTAGNDPAPQQVLRYQFGNHLGSASLELDDQAQIISYEEYTPYGSTSYQAVRSHTETPKRYRYTGKERDEETGLYYMGARYYAPWLGRWTSADPIGVGADGPGLYNYVQGSPIGFSDPSGTQGLECRAPSKELFPSVAKPPQTVWKPQTVQKTEDQWNLEQFWVDLHRPPGQSIPSSKLARKAQPSAPPPPVSPTDYTLYVPEGVLYSQFKAAEKEVFSPDNSWGVIGVMFVLASAAALPALAEEYIARPTANIPFAVHNAGLKIGEHGGRAYLWNEQGETGEAVVESLEAVVSTSEGFVAGASVGVPVTGAIESRVAAARASIVPNGSLGGANGITYPNLTLQNPGGLLGRRGLRKPVFNPTFDVVANPVGSTLAGVTRHEAVHVADMLRFPQFSYMGTTSRLPGRGVAAFLMETRGYYAEFGARGLLPQYALRSLTSMEKSYLVGEVGAFVAGAGTAGYLGYED
jgi:RHS repeat-associated protein